jgi:hypothetical protein
MDSTALIGPPALNAAEIAYGLRNFIQSTNEMLATHSVADSSTAFRPDNGRQRWVKQLLSELKSPNMNTSLLETVSITTSQASELIGN